MVSRDTALKGLAVAGVVVLLVAGVGGYLLWTSLEEPVVESVESELGTVTDESTNINSTIVVTNPNDRTLRDVTVRYDVDMNDVRMGTGTASNLTLTPGRNVFEVTAVIDNDNVPDWWVSHIERNEETNLTTTASVSVGGFPLSFRLPPRHRPMDTDFVGALTDEPASNVTLGNETLLAVGERGGEWGEPTLNRTPLHIQSTLVNRHNRTVNPDELAYTIRMNGVVVGQGTDEGFALDPGDRRTVTIEAHVTPHRMQEWWVTHFQGEQTSNLSVSVAAVIHRDDEREELPLPAMGTRAVFQTDVFGNGSTAVTRLPPPEGLSFERPSVENRSSRWGEPNETVTPIVTTVRGSNPNDGPVADVLWANVSHSTTIGEFEVASKRTVTPLPRDTFTVTTRSTMRHDEVPIWWAAHLDRGERSTVYTAVTGHADAGITTFPLGLEDTNQTVETDMLAGLNDESSQAVTVEGRRALTVEWTRASWETVSPERASIQVRMRIHNERPAEAAIRDLNYTVQLGQTTLADRDSPDEWTFNGSETKVIETSLHLNNSRMADWWPGHVRRGEQSRLRVDSYATVESGSESERTRLDFLGDDRVIHTDLLGQANGTDA